jgi:hypothetical protein
MRANNVHRFPLHNTLIEEFEVLSDMDQHGVHYKRIRNNTTAQSQAPGSQAALAELCRLYWYPIYAFVRRRGHDVDEAQELTQGFFLHLLDHKALRQVSPVKGKFRLFLVASLENYLLDEADPLAPP